uniref:Uncharacterized protein n=1 Tax=Siphoviridae sp. ctjOC2 TaxID=2825632 RepID=A0A8S5Q948_9CAUD|nr:MAG TPA: hypothetical protein [Siphoviridae sp. ctjOC2]
MLRPASGIKDSPGLVGRPKGCGGSIPPEGARPQRGACCIANSIVETPNCPFLVRGGLSLPGVLNIRPLSGSCSGGVKPGRLLVSCLVKIIAWFYAGSTPAMSATRLTSRAGTAPRGLPQPWGTPKIQK